MPRHSSFTIMQTFVKWGRVGQYVAGKRVDTTVPTTKACQTSHLMCADTPTAQIKLKPE